LVKIFVHDGTIPQRNVLKPLVRSSYDKDRQIDTKAKMNNPTATSEERSRISVQTELFAARKHARAKSFLRDTLWPKLHRVVRISPLRRSERDRSNRCAVTINSKSRRTAVNRIQ
jgi:hypothetical protein